MTKTNKDYVLIVEDSADIRELMSLYLECEDFEVIAAADGYEAMEKMANYQPKVVLTKGYFNNEDEFGLIKTIRQTEPFNETPVVAMLDARNGHLPAIKAGASKIIRVPDAYSQLPKIVKEFLAACDKN
jgi:PleD family two-component response regulator